MQLYQALITLDGWTFLAQICNLMIQLVIFKKLLLNPVKKVIAERKAKADGTWVDPKAAEAAKAEAAAKTLTGNGTMTAAPEVNGSAVTYTVSCEEVQ